MDGGNVLIFGGIIVDSYMMVKEYPVRGQDVLINDSFERIGGCAVNVAQTLKNLGMQPYIVSAVGGDIRGDMIKSYIEDNRFDASCIKQLEGESSGYCVTILEGAGERTFLTYKGCESYFSPYMTADELMAKISYVYVTGYYLLDERYSSNIIEAIGRLKDMGSKILFDPGPLAQLIEKDTLLWILSKADIITPNETEAETIKSILALDAEPENWFKSTGIELLVLKQGSRGVKVWSKDMSFVMPSFKVDVIDTTGAGDSFAAGLIYGLSHGLSTCEAVNVACACGAITATFKGPHGKFGIEDIKNLTNMERDKAYDR
ncbi:carbohydrate kinase family protein [Lutispora saccharofermentans]|uniref:Carbohydrate kinase family protein n=1 Tax=Lutispora saccharofermentans TaxID=3024236 RepID=A0ABT1NHQ2_9FIRM|nr:carbohydrate kinase family protein [Lutispora saccharofermentans]MCQ1529683.1 carbohydrate kinase family protein [Lutispora saccharofermentans]